MSGRISNRSQQLPPTFPKEPLSGSAKGEPVKAAAREWVAAKLQGDGYTASPSGSPPVVLTPPAPIGPQPPPPVDAGRFSAINQYHPNGQGQPNPEGYNGASTCAPTSLAMVLRYFGVQGLPEESGALVQQLAQALGTSPTAGTAAENIPALVESLGLRAEQRPMRDSTFAYSHFHPPSDDQWSAAQEALGMSDEAFAQLRRQQSPDTIRQMAWRAETERFIARSVEGGSPVLLNVSAGVLHPKANIAGGHYVVVVGVERGEDGRITSYQVMDPASPESENPRTIPVETMWEAMEGNSLCAPTAISQRRPAFDLQPFFVR